MPKQDMWCDEKLSTSSSQQRWQNLDEIRRYLTMSKLWSGRLRWIRAHVEVAELNRIDQRGSSTWWQTGEKWVEVLRNRCCLNFLSDHAGLAGNRWSGRCEPRQSRILLLLSRAAPQVLFCCSVVLVAAPACRQQLQKTLSNVFVSRVDTC